jgi:signal transduction histidine kinase
MSILEMRCRMLTGIDEHIADLKKAHEEKITIWSEAANVIIKTNLESKIELEKAVHERTLELQKANHARGEYLATINHEMRTPLNGILGMVEILQLKPSTAEQKEQLDHLGVASRQLAGLVGDVLDFSKIDENLTVVKTEDFSSHSLVQDLTSLFSLSAKQKDIDLSLQLETGVSDWLRGDMPYLKQILTNLISNAIKFTEAGEVRLVISTSQPNERESEYQANLITFKVSDTGCGMEQADLEHIFLP